MVSFEVEIFACVGGLPVEFGGQCRLYPDCQNIQKGNHTLCELDRRPQTIEVAEEIL
jgi:hypothetical protein